MSQHSIVRKNLLADKNYRPYCGNDKKDACYNPRTERREIDGQFICPNCKWVSKFPPDFIRDYNTVHHL